MAKRVFSRKRKAGKESDAGDMGAVFLRNLRDAAIKEYGQAEVPEFDEFMHVPGIPLTGNLVLQYVLGTDLLPFGRLISVLGPPAGGKTQFCLWLGRQFILNNGLFLHLEAERKQSPTLITSVLQIERDALKNRFIPCYVRTIQDLEQKLNWYGRFYQQHFPDKNMPMFILVDSVSALTGDKALSEYSKGDVGENNMQAAHNAKSLTENLRKYVAEFLVEEPFLLAMVAHQKEEINIGWSPSPMKTKTFGTGGIHKDFQATWRLIIESGTRRPYLTGDGAGAEDHGRQEIVHTITADKSCMGEDRRKVTYSTITYVDPATDELRADFEWDAALVQLLLDEKKTGKRYLKQALGLSKTPMGYDIDVLKLKGLKAAEAGKVINASAELSHDLQSYFRISRYQAKTEKIQESGCDVDEFE
jgi:hypothetical protein